MLGSGIGWGNEMMRGQHNVIGGPSANPLSPHVGQPQLGGGGSPLAQLLMSPNGPISQQAHAAFPGGGAPVTAPAPPPSQPTPPTPQPQLGGGSPPGMMQPPQQSLPTPPGQPLPGAQAQNPMGNIMSMLGQLFGGHGGAGGLPPQFMQMLGGLIGGQGMGQAPGQAVHPMANGVSSAYSQAPGNLMFGSPQAQPYSFFQPPGSTGTFTPPAGTQQRGSGQTPPSIGMNGLGGGMRSMGGMGGELGGLPGAGNIQY